MCRNYRSPIGAIEYHITFVNLLLFLKGFMIVIFPNNEKYIYLNTMV